MQELVRGAAVAFLVKVAGAGLTVGLSVAIARLLGPEWAGIYFLSVSLLTVASVVGRLGLDDSLLRFTAATWATEDWDGLRGVTRIGVRLGALGLAVSGIVLLASAGWLSVRVFSKPMLAAPLRVMAVAVIPFGLLNLQGELLKGTKRILESQVVQGVITPGLTLTLVLVLARSTGVVGAAWSYVVAAAAGAGVGAYLWRRVRHALPPGTHRFQLRTLLSSSVPSYWVSTTNLVMTWTGTIAMGIWRPSSEVAVFSVAARMAVLISFVLLAVNSMVAPQFAALYRQNEMRALAKLARESTILMTLLASPLIVAFLVFPHAIIGIFGHGFADAAVLLPIIGLGQFVNVATGAVGYLLMMSGNERLLRNSHIVGASLSVVGNCVLVPKYGALGAAIATAVTLASVNLISVGLVYRRLGIMTIPLPRRLFASRVEVS